MLLLLDTGVLGMICHPKKNRPLASWFQAVLADPNEMIQILLPGISGYELRRKLLHLSKYRKRSEARKSPERLDALVALLQYLPLDQDTMLRAAELWADARGQGESVAADAALDGDVILAAQAQRTNGAVITTNTKHLSRFVDSYNWAEFIDEKMGT